MKNKRGLEEVNSRSSGYKTSSKKFLYGHFGVIPKTTSRNLSKPIHDTINYSTFICPFVSGSVERKG